MKELAAAGAPIRVPVAVSRRVLKLHRQHYYAWLSCPVADAEYDEAYVANAIFDAHREDSEFGCRLLFDQVRAAGRDVSERMVWKMCSISQWWCAFGKKRRGRKGLPGAPAHEDLVRRNVTAPGPNRLWLADITEHRTAEGKIYICAVKDVWSNRIVGYSIAERMTSQLAVDALESAVAAAAAPSPVARSTPTGAVNFVPANSNSRYGATRCSAPWDRSAPPGTTPPWKASCPCCNATSSTANAGPPATTFASRSSPGSNAPTTAADDKPAWAD
nr:DDE-type integrase/transposase/recombinase [Mycobacterium marinum]